MGRALLVVVIMVCAAGVAVAQDPDTSPCAGRVDLENGGFEDPDKVDEFGILLEDNVPGWSTTEPDGRIELWQSGYNGVPAAVGEQFAELSANEEGELYQERATTPGARLSYAVNHRGRKGVDTMEIRIGPAGGPPNFTRQVSTGNTEWQQVLGTYTVPAGQTTTRFAFAAISNASGNTSIGNFLDGVAFTEARCSVSVSKRLAPATDPGRFDLLIGDDVVAAAAGDGDGSARVPLPLAAVTVSERGAAGTSLGAYASAIRCVDADSGELVAQGPGSQLTFSFDRRRDVDCTVTNVPGPAVVLEEEVAPPAAGARFNLRVDGRLVASRAGDGAVVGPTRVEAGQVTVGEQAAAGTSPSAYESAIQCRSGAGLGPVVASVKGTQATFAVEGTEVVRCVLLNVRRPSPAPDPAPRLRRLRCRARRRPPRRRPTLDLVTRTRPVERGVAAGGPVRFRMRITNLGPVEATGVGILPVLRQGVARVRDVRLSVPGGLCVTVRGGGACSLPRLAAGASVTVAVAARSRPGAPSPVRLTALARPREPERVLRNDVDSSLVHILRAGEGCPAAASRRGPIARAAC